MYFFGHYTDVVHAIGIRLNLPHAHCLVASINLSINGIFGVLVILCASQ